MSGMRVRRCLMGKIIALVIDVIIRIPKPRRRLNFNPFVVIPKSFIYTFSIL